MSIASIRKDYQLKSLDESDVQPNAIDQFSIWWDEALKAQIEEVNAMTLCTTRPDGRPSARIVLLKGFDQAGFVFYTNYESEKGKHLAGNPFASIVFFWKELERQVRIEGACEKVTDDESDAYFRSRPLGSRIGAWVSPQSRTISGRSELEQRTEEIQKRFNLCDVSRPPHWGGYRVVPETIEYWQGRSNRLHDRILYTKKGNNWEITRLAP